MEDNSKMFCQVILMVVAVLCIILALSTAFLSLQINNERLNQAALMAQISDLKIRLTSSGMKSEEYMRVIKDTQYSFDIAKTELDKARKEIIDLKTINADLESKIKALGANVAVPQ